MYTHITKRTRQRCYPAVFWPTKCREYVARERKWPLMVLESGQITRIAARNLWEIQEQA